MGITVSQRYFTTEQAAVRCGYSVSYLEKLRNAGRGPAYRQPDGKKSIRYFDEDLDAWMNSNKIQTVESITL